MKYLLVCEGQVVSVLLTLEELNAFGGRDALERVGFVIRSVQVTDK